MVYLVTCWDGKEKKNLYFDNSQEDVLCSSDEFLSVLSQTGLDAEFLGCQQHMLSRHSDWLQQGRHLRVQNCILCLTYLPGSNISQPSVSANLKVTCWNVTFIFLYKQPCMLNFFVSVNSTLYVPGGHCCHVLCSFSHSLSRLLQLAELFWFLCTVTQQHQVAQMTCEGCHHLLHRRSPDQPVVQQRGHSWQSDSAWLKRKVQYHLLWGSRCFQCGGCMNNLLYSTEELDVRVS